MVVSGRRDAAALVLAVSGLVFVGPLALLFPERPGRADRTRRNEAPLADLHRHVPALGLVLLLLTLRPRLVIYNISADQLPPILAEIAQRLDADARWAGDSLFYRGWACRSTWTACAGCETSRWSLPGQAGPPRLGRGYRPSLTAALRSVEAPRGLGGLLLLSAGNVLVLWLAWEIMQDPQAIARTVLDLLSTK